MYAGSLDERVTIQSFTSTRSAVGDVVASWSTDATVWARVTELKGREKYETSQLVDKADIEVMMRHRSLDHKNRLIYNSEYYNIYSIQEIRRKRGLMVLAKRIQQT